MKWGEVWGWQHVMHTFVVLTLLLPIIRPGKTTQVPLSRKTLNDFPLPLTLQLPHYSKKSRQNLQIQNYSYFPSISKAWLHSMFHLSSVFPTASLNDFPIIFPGNIWLPSKRLFPKIRPIYWTVSRSISPVLRIFFAVLSIWRNGNGNGNRNRQSPLSELKSFRFDIQGSLCHF
jgi:hypothetical protein